MLDQTRPRLLVDWDIEETHARRRESGLAAGVLHLALLLLIVLNPQIFPEPTLAQEAERQVTILYLPSDWLKIPEPQTPPDLTPEERSRMIVRPPLTLDPRRLAELLPPPLPPAVTLPPTGEAGATPDSELPSPPSSQTGSAQLEGERKQIARLEDLPRPERGARPGLQLPMTSPGRAIEESLRQGPGAPGGSPGEPGAPGGLIEPNLNTPFPQILSDTRGVDFTPYLIRLLREVRRNWYALMPESVRWGERGSVVIVFSVLKDGSVPFGQPTLVRSSARSHLDRAALAAIRASQPFPPLPAEFTGPNLVLQFTFLYNLPLDYTEP